MSAGSTAIAVVAKAPVPGRVKTRMHPLLTPADAAALAAAMLWDVTAAALATGARVWWSYAGDRAVLDPLRPPEVALLAQVGADLSARLAHAHWTLHDGGAERVVLVGADCPTLGADDLDDAVALLAANDAVLAPASDGGYTLLGTRTCAPSLLADVEMSTERTAADTLAQATRLGLEVAVMPTRPDLDTPADLRAALDGGWLTTADRTRRLARRLLPT